jgi:flagellar hook-associated protein 1 FlgK
VHEVAANPSSMPARQSMLSMAQALVGRFQSVDTRLNEIRDGVDAQLAGTVTDINSYATPAGRDEPAHHQRRGGGQQPAPTTCSTSATS